MAQLPVTVNLNVYRGDSWFQTFRLLEGTVPLNLTGKTVVSQARNNGGAIFNLVVTIEDATDGRFHISLPSGSLKPGAYSYDVEIDNGAEVTTWIHGRMAVARDVTNELP